MEWPRVKSILIVMLAIVNIFLFVAYANSEIRDAREEKTALAHTVSVLEKRGFSIDENIVPKKSMLLYPTRAERNVNWENSVATALLGAADRDRLGTTVHYCNDRGDIQFRNNGYFEITIAESGVSNKAEMEDYVYSLVKKFGIKISHENIAVEEEAQSFRASVNQNILGVPIYNGRLNVWVLPDGSAKITGRLVSDKITVLRGEKPYEINGILVGLIQALSEQGINSGKIEAISAGYRISTSADSTQVGVLYAVPVWNVRIDGEDYFVSAMNGKMIYLD